MYAMVFTRPDIAHVVGVVSKYMNNSGKENWEEIKWILRYLRGIASHALCFGGSDTVLLGYVDSDMAGDKDNKMSTTGYVFTIGGTTISWISKLKRLFHFQQHKQSMLLLQRLVKRCIGLWRNWERSRRIEGGIHRVPFILQRTEPSIQRLKI
jgi:hypothetical protein